MPFWFTNKILWPWDGSLCDDKSRTRSFVQALFCDISLDDSKPDLDK